MAAVVSTITHTLLTAGSDPANTKTYTTASISPAPNTLVTLAVMGQAGSAAPSPVVTGGGMASWVEVVSTTFDSVTVPQKRLTIFRAMSAAPGSGPITIKFGPTESNCQWIVSQWDGVDLSGANGAGAIGQTGAIHADKVTSLAVTLGAFGSSANVAYGVFGVKKNTAAITPGAGFAEIAEQPSGETTAADLQAEWAVNDNSIDASWVKLNAGALGVEIRSAGSAPPVPVASVEVTPATSSIVVNGTVQLSAAPKDVGGEPLGGRTVTWSSSAPQVATVSTDGLVTGAAAGSATITATSEGVDGTATVTVTTSAVPVASVTVAPSTPTVSVGAKVQLTATPKDASGNPLTGRVITWATSAPQTATVSATGLVTGVAPGAATITATSEGKDGTANVTVTSQPVPALVGQWSSVLPSPVILLHLHLMLDGRVLGWGHDGEPQVWDPATGNFAEVTSPSELFCAGHNFLPDGRLLVAGGALADGKGLPNTNIFDPASGSWLPMQSMAYARWYPTNTTLPNGEVLTIGGTDQTGAVVTIPEVWNGSSWRQLTSAALTLPNYPRTFVAPDGRVFYAGVQAQSRYLDVTGTGSWTNGPVMKYGPRTYGSAVEYAPGKILVVGGDSPPTNTAETIDLNAPSPQWSYTGSMAYNRWNLNATLLPTGDVLVTGGTSFSNRADPAGAVFATELWNPTNGSWTQLASNAVFRGYHSTTVLLPDGRVIHGGGGDGGGTPNNLNYEIYSPPYLFNGARPTVTGGTPANVSYGQVLNVQTPDGAAITKVNFIRLSSVTHAFNESQLLIPLNFSQVGGGVSVTLPSSHITAPPGPYMIFLVNSNGVPSVGKIMLLN
ncbi:MAG: Ig-like domain-containing protein [Gemmatimonadales bacterium]